MAIRPIIDRVLMSEDLKAIIGNDEGSLEPVPSPDPIIVVVDWIVGSSERPFTGILQSIDLGNEIVVSLRVQVDDAFAFLSSSERNVGYVELHHGTVVTKIDGPFTPHQVRMSELDPVNQTCTLGFAVKQRSR
jgi:hypothetical protein